MAFIRELVHQESGLALSPSQSYLIEARLLGMARRKGLDSIDPLVAALDDPSNELRGEFIENMAPKETSFFRERHVFEDLAQWVLPELIAARGGSKALRIWSAGCSSGQEPFSLVMLLQDRFAEIDDWEVTVSATDLSEEMLTRVREARYSQLEVNRGLPDAYLKRFFVRDGRNWQLDESCRRRVSSSRMNLVEDWTPHEEVDLVFLRNVLIYFDEPTQRRVLERVRRRMKPDAYLFLGGVETTFQCEDLFDRVQFARATAYRVRTTRG